ncbi:MAG: DUF1156 domain-containing protein [Candidatus Sulfotelmatobacter sp.]
MIPKECKRLAEVDFPIAAVSKHSAREKSIRHGHPSTLHLWWARRPLAACRAMLMALLLPDPCDPNCPDEFKQRVRNILPRVQGAPGKKDIELRTELLRFIGDFANWDNSTNPTFLEAARGLVRAAHGKEAPLVVDPFAGGGSIPLEAARLGCDAFASDLNPVACLILRTIVQDIPRHPAGLVDDFRRATEEIKKVVENELVEYYPPDTDGAKPIAYVWARTVTCDSCGAEVPLVRSFWLGKKANHKRALRFSVTKRAGKVPTLEFEVFEPKKESDIPAGSVSRAKATCLCCHVVMPPERVRPQLTQQRGGANPLFANKKRCGGARLLAVVTKLERAGRNYRTATEADYAPITKALCYLESLRSRKLPDGTSIVPDETLPLMSGTFNVPIYGMDTWGALFTARQTIALLAIGRETQKLSQINPHLSGLLSLTASRCADYNSSLTRWVSGGEFVGGTFGRQALGMIWDFCEAYPMTDESGGYPGASDWVARVTDRVVMSGISPGQVSQSDARHSLLPAESADIVFTDPPYYFAVPYADLSDFFFVWLKRMGLADAMPSDLEDKNNPLTPKAKEICEMAHWDTKRYAHKDKKYFELAMAEAFSESKRIMRGDGIGCVVFAHKTTEGWEALLSGMINGGWVITGSWPISTERPGRLRSQDSAALATSVHLICRPRSANAGIGDWAEILRELPQRVGEWIERLQSEGIRGADLVFACIGPSMEIYSRYRRVEDAEGREIPLGGDPSASEPYRRGFLAYVWETVGRLALEQVLGTAEARARNGAAGALEEDSRLTALFLWTLQTTETESSDAEAESSDDGDNEEEDTPTKKKAGLALIYDVARRFAQPLGIHLDKWEGRIIETEKGVVRLLPVSERAMQLFGDVDASAISRRIEQDVKASRNYEFAFMQDVAAPPEIRPRARRRTVTTGAAVAEAPAVQPVTTLDRVHAAMLLQASGQSNGLRAMLKEEQQRGPDFLRLANALSALYPKDSEEKRLLDAMLLAVPRN